MQQTCFREEVLQFSNPLFKKIKLTILLTMEGSSRRSRYLKQLHDFKPSETVIVIHNQGYKKCEKPEWVTNTAMDLWHTNLTAFALHQKSIYSATPLLLLEDDVEFVPIIRELANEIETFITQNNVDFYSLGGIPVLCVPSFIENHVRVYSGHDAHALIYTANGMQKAKDVPKKSFHDNMFTKYMNSWYSKTVCAIQDKTELTENSQLWSSSALLTYSKLFGRNFYKCHHAMTIVGGVFPFYIICIICIIVKVTGGRSLLSLGLL